MYLLGPTDLCTCTIVGLWNNWTLVTVELCIQWWVAQRDGTLAYCLYSRRRTWQSGSGDLKSAALPMIGIALCKGRRCPQEDAFIERNTDCLAGPQRGWSDGLQQGQEDHHSLGSHEFCLVRQFSHKTLCLAKLLLVFVHFLKHLLGQVMPDIKEGTQKLLLCRQFVAKQLHTTREIDDLVKISTT